MSRKRRRPNIPLSRRRRFRRAAADPLETLEGRVRMSRRSGATFAGCAGWVSARRQAGIGLIGLRQNRCCARPMDRRPERRRRVPMPDTHYEILIIGAGQAGPGLAVALAKRGKHVALAECKDIGGSCVNFGCTPTKAAIASARVAHLARRAGEFGLRIPTVEVDFAAVLERAKSIVVKSRTGLQQWLEGTENLNLLKAHARFEGKDGDRFRVSVGGQRVTAAQVVLDYQRLGSRVIVIEGAGQVAGNEDPEIAAALQQLLENEGVEFRLNTQVTRIEGRTGKLRLILNGAGSAAVEATDVFVATGRRANTDDLGLETIGVATSKRGIVTADERLSTNVKGVWVAGDIRGGPMFTHTAWDDYRSLESQIAGDGSKTLDRVIPYAVFTDPELGRVGMTEREARAAGHAVRIGRFELRRNGKAVEVGETAGFIKVVADERSQRLLGAAVLANEGAELVHIYIDLMNARAPYPVIRDAVYIHPTLAEAVQSAVATL